MQRNLKDQFGGDFASTAFQRVDGESRMVGKFGSIAQLDDGSFDAWFVGPDLEPLSPRKLSAIEKKMLTNWAFREAIRRGLYPRAGRGLCPKGCADYGSTQAPPRFPKGTSPIAPVGEGGGVMGKRKRGEAHVRLHRHEIECAAYRSLSPEGRALLVEARALYTGGKNRVYMSVRWIRERLNVGQWKAVKARDELIDRGFLRLLCPGGFNVKQPHAPEYALTHIPLKPDEDGATPPKDFMRWQKSAVLVTNKAGTSDSYREAKSEGQNPRHGTSHPYREPQETQSHGISHPYTDSVTRAALLRGAMCCGGENQLKMILGAMAPSGLEAAA